MLEYASFDAAVDALRRRQWLVLDVQAQTDAPQDSSPLTLDIGRYFPVRAADLELSLRQLAVMLRSGLTLLEGLRLLVDYTHQTSLRAVWKAVSDDILSGESLGNSMAKHRCFPQVVVQLARVGEQTGDLDVVLSRGADIVEQWRRLRSQILTAMAYPAVVFLASLFVAGFMVFHVIPKLQQFLQNMGKTLPLMTQILVDVTEFINRYVLYGVAGIVIVVVGTVALRMWPPGRLATDWLLLKMPVFGGVFRLGGTAAFARNLSTLIQSGVTVLDGMSSIEKLLNNRYLAAIVSAARDEVVQGRTVADALQSKAGFTPMLARMIAIGESAGRLDDVLDEAARFYEDQLQRTIRRLAALVEPAMLLVVGGIVGFVYLSFFMALFAAAR